MYLLFVRSQAVTDNHLITIGATSNSAPTKITHPMHHWRIGKNIVSLTTGNTGATTLKTL